MGKMGLFKKKIPMEMTHEIFPDKETTMTRNISPSQAKNLIRQMQYKQKLAINRYNQTVRDYNRKVNQAIDQYNREINRINQS
jgi:hypothetical protein